MVTVKLYVEGGGDSDELRSRCREGFRKFLEKTDLKGRMPRVVACGGRHAAYDRFKTACGAGELCMLLLDSEVPVEDVSVEPWTFLENREEDGFSAPPNATADQCHLMVVCMESWFLADKQALATFFGQGFNEKPLPRNDRIEAVSKQEVYSGMQSAAAHCKTKAPYGKGAHSFDILALIDPLKVAEASPWAERFIKTLKTFMTSLHPS